MVQSASHLTDMLLQSPFLTSSLASFQQTSVSPTRAESTRGSAVWWGAYTVCPGEGKATNLGEKGIRKAEVTSYVSNINWENNSCFQLLLKPKIRPHSVLVKQHGCHLSAHAWDGDYARALDTAAATSNSVKLQNKLWLVQAWGTTFARSTASGKPRDAEAPHTSPARWFTRTINQVVRSCCSEVSCKWLLTDLKNYPVYLHPSLRYRGRWAEPICSLRDSLDLLKSTCTINHCYQLWSKTGNWGIWSNLFISRLAPLELLLSLFVGFG